MLSTSNNYRKARGPSDLQKVSDDLASEHPEPLTRPLLAEGYTLERVIEDVDAIHEIGRLRVAVWNHDQPQIRSDLVKEGMWLDTLDFRPNAEHWVIRHEGRIVASCRISFHISADEVPDSDVMAKYAHSDATLYSSINRLVIHPDHHKKGLRNVLDLIRVYSAKQKNSSQLFAYAVGEKRCQTLMNLGFEKLTQNFGLDILPSVEGPYIALSLDPSNSPTNNTVISLYLKAVSNKNNHS